MKPKRRKQWRKLSAAEKEKVLAAFNAGEKRTQILQLYKITQSQLFRIIRDAAGK